MRYLYAIGEGRYRLGLNVQSRRRCCSYLTRVVAIGTLLGSVSRILKFELKSLKGSSSTEDISGNAEDNLNDCMFLRVEDFRELSMFHVRGSNNVCMCVCVCVRVFVFVHAMTICYTRICLNRACEFLHSADRAYLQFAYQLFYRFANVVVCLSVFVQLRLR